MIEHRYRVDGARIGDGFQLYAAISRVFPAAHGARWAIARTLEGFAIRGPEAAPAITAITIHRPARVRLQESVPLAPSEFLRASIAIVRLTAPPPSSSTEFRQRVYEHVADRGRALGARDVRIGTHELGVRVHGRLIKGFEAWCWTPDADASIAIQATGIGGKRSMGCGVFFGVDVKDTPWG